MRITGDDAFVNPVFGYVGICAKDQRAKQGITVEYVIEKTGLSLDDLNKFENGEKFVGVKTLFKIAKLYGVGMEAFMPDHAQQCLGWLVSALSNDEDIEVFRSRYCNCEGDSIKRAIEKDEHECFLKKLERVYEKSERDLYDELKKNLDKWQEEAEVTLSDFEKEYGVRKRILSRMSAERMNNGTDKIDALMEQFGGRTRKDLIAIGRIKH